MFKTAVKHESKLRMAIAGPSGSGKTYTALAIATALSPGKVALVDTEHKSASKYADIFAFDVLEMEPPYHPERFVNAIKEAAQAGYETVILDTLSPAWNGTGGLLEIVDRLALKYKGNSFAAWKDATPIYNSLIDAIVGAGIHVVVTMRSKQDYVLDTDSDGKTRPKKVGMAPIQRDGFEYEFDIFCDMDIDNVGRVTKSRCAAISGKAYKKPGKELGEVLKEWLTGEPAPASLPEVLRRKLHAVGTKAYGAEWDAKRHELVQAITKGASASSKDLTAPQAEILIDGIENLKAKKFTSAEDDFSAQENAEAADAML